MATRPDRQKKPPYRPTPLCPHRYCPRLHNLNGLCGVAFIGSSLFNANLLWLLFFLLLSVLAYAVQRAVWGRSHKELAMEDAAQSASATPHGSGGRVLIARKGWARAAAGSDIVTLAVIALVLSRMGNYSEAAYSVPSGDASSYITLGLALSFVAFTAIAHRKAAEPAKPARAAVPATAQGNA